MCVGNSKTNLNYYTLKPLNSQSQVICAQIIENNIDFKQQPTPFLLIFVKN